MGSLRLAGQTVPVGTGVSTILADMDFETYSAAGYHIDPETGKRSPIVTGQKSGLAAVGAARYAEHPSTEVISLAYDLKDGAGPRLWVPGLPAPLDLFAHIKAGGLVEAHNSMFEFLIWSRVCVGRLGWPELPLRQLRCSAAQSRAYAYPGKLSEVAQALGGPVQKDKRGKALINKFSVPLTPTKKDPRRRHHVHEDPIEASEFYEYNINDIRAEAAVSERIQDLTPDALELWLIDQEINARGVHVDRKALGDCIAIVDQAFEKYNTEINRITDGAVSGASKVQDIKNYCASHGLELEDLTKETVAEALKNFSYLDEAVPGAPILPHMQKWHDAQGCRRVLEIRAIIGSAAIKKLFAADRAICDDDRLRDLFIFHKAHTGRFAGAGAQPQNFPNSGLAVHKCECGAFYVPQFACPACFDAPVGNPREWNVEAVEFALHIISFRDLSTVELYFGDAIAAVSGCLRGLFIAAPGKELINSDFSAIEAVILACLAGEQWRIDVFNGHGKIYEMSAAKITGVPFEEFMRHKEETGDHHPLRKKVGKVAELASGYQGGLGAWKQFGADKFMNDEEIEDAKNAWRKESPNIVKFWYGVERAARKAIQMPGTAQEYNGIRFGVKDDILFLRLLSGRYLKYHKPRLHKETTPWGKEVLKITFMGIDAKTKKWVRKDTYGGRLTENIVQATGADIFTFAMVNLTKAGYPLVLHTHDETTSEIDAAYGSIEEYENIMQIRPDWCASWPIRAAGGWRGKRYRKD